MRREYFSLPSVALLTLFVLAGTAGCNQSSNTASIPQAGNLTESSVGRDGGSSGFLYVLSEVDVKDGLIAVYSGSPLKYVREIQAGLSIPTSMVANAQGQLFVSNFFSENVPIYKPNGTKPVRILSKDLKEPMQVAVTSKNDAYVRGKRVITIFLNSHNKQTKTIRMPALRLATDAASNVYAIGSKDNTIFVFPPEGIKPSREITQGLDNPQNLIADSSGNLYVANDSSSGCGNITVYDAASSTVKYTITDGVCSPLAMTFDPAGNLYVGNDAEDSVTEYAAGTNSLVETISKGIKLPTYLTTDASGTLYVANYGQSFTGDITIYPQGHTTPSETLTKNIGLPTGLVWLPGQ